MMYVLSSRINSSTERKQNALCSGTDRENEQQESQLETMLDEVCERERQLVAQMAELQQLKASRLVVEQED